MIKYGSQFILLLIYQKSNNDSIIPSLILNPLSKLLDLYLSPLVNRNKTILIFIKIIKSQ